MPAHSISSRHIPFATWKGRGTLISELVDIVSGVTAKRPSISKISIVARKRLLKLDASPLPWQDAFRTLTVDFGESSGDFAIRRHKELRKRQEDEPTRASTLTRSDVLTRIKFPTPSSSASTDGKVSAHADIGSRFIDQSIFPLEIPGSESVSSDTLSLWVTFLF